MTHILVHFSVGRILLYSCMRICSLPRINAGRQTVEKIYQLCHYSKICVCARTHTQGTCSSPPPVTSLGDKVLLLLGGFTCYNSSSCPGIITNVALWHICATTVAMKKLSVLNITSVSVLLPYLSSMQSSCALLYCNLWPVWLYHNFPHYIINGMTFGKKLLYIKCVF